MPHTVGTPAATVMPESDRLSEWKQPISPKPQSAAVRFRWANSAVTA